MSQRHFIRRQLFELHLQDDHDVFGLQQTLSRQFWDAVVPKMEELFDQLVTDDQVITIDKLEIDLGSIPLKQLISEEGLSKLIGQLSLVLSGKIEISGHKQPKTSTGANVWEQWFHFLKFGSIPWSCETPEAEWWQTVLKEFVINVSLVERLRKLLVDYPMTINRLAWQHSDDFLTSLVEIHSGFSHKDLMDTHDKLIAWYLKTHGLIKIPVSISGSQTRTFKKDPRWYRAYFWVFVLRLVIHNKESVDTKSLMTKYLQELFTAEQLHFWMMPGNIEKKMAKAYPVVCQLLLEIRKSNVQDLAEPRKQAKDKTFPKDHDKPATEHTSGQEEVTASAEISGTSTEQVLPGLGIDIISNDLICPVPENSDQVWYVNAAGMVLLHPFLTRFFEKLELIKDGEFSTTEHQYRAIHLLQFMATGQYQPMEYELPLAKVLCGWPQGTPLPKDVVFEDREIEECENLLSALIENWSILGNTSIEGLQEGFLLRQGKLDFQDDHWQLWVEQKSIDLLLDQLPWNLSIIKLPWMKELLRVEWR